MTNQHHISKRSHQTGNWLVAVKPLVCDRFGVSGALGWVCFMCLCTHTHTHRVRKASLWLEGCWLNPPKWIRHRLTFPQRKCHWSKVKYVWLSFVRRVFVFVCVCVCVWDITQNREQTLRELCNYNRLFLSTDVSEWVLLSLIECFSCHLSLY